MAVNAGVTTLQGTSRVQNEDRQHVVVNPNAGEGEISAYYGVYDGHGGDSTAIWLTEKLYGFVSKRFSTTDPKSSIIRAFEQADEDILEPRGGFLGIGAQRGVGGAKCGATAAVAMLFKKDGATSLLAAGIGDSMVMKKSKSGLEWLTTEHVPDNEEERKRIELFNPNPKMPLVRYVGDTWRVGGLLALSRAFGDAYLKPSSDFEGVGYQDADYASGFGLIAKPDVTISPITTADEWMLVASDGLFETEKRGGGGGLTPEQINEIVTSMKGQPAEQISAKLASSAVAAGSTDDVTVIFVPFK